MKKRPQPNDREERGHNQPERSVGRTFDLFVAREVLVHGGVRFRYSMQCKFWSERRDSNPRPLVPQTSALTGLRHAPTALL